MMSRPGSSSNSKDGPPIAGLQHTTAPLSTTATVAAIAAPHTTLSSSSNPPGLTFAALAKGRGIGNLQPTLASTTAPNPMSILAGAEQRNIASAVTKSSFLSSTTAMPAYSEEILQMLKGGPISSVSGSIDNKSETHLLNEEQLSRQMAALSRHSHQQQSLQSSPQLSNELRQQQHPMSPINASPSNPSISTISSNIYALGGLLSVIRMTDPGLNALALGTDLTALGLDLNSPDAIYPAFLSPWAESKNNLDHILPPCYNVQPPPPAINKISQFSDETLFYIFYSMPRDELQDLAAQELYNRQWKYHKELKVWLTKDPLSTSTTEPSSASGPGTVERGTFIFFDVLGWEKIKKEFVLVWEQIEDRPVHKPHQQQLPSVQHTQVPPQQQQKPQ